MDIRISTGLWIAGLRQEILAAHDGDTFILPSNAHNHAFEIATKNTNTTKQFKVRIQK